MAAVIAYLGRMVPDRRTPAPDALSPLRDLAWLPARGDHAWHRPAEVHTVFRETLFATQGRFLDIPQRVQQDAADFLHWLGVETNPSVSQVVAHLVTRAGQQAPVSREVYIELNRNAADPAIGRLKGTACLLLPGGTYARPEAVFRQANPFGRFRQLLGPDFDAIGDLLDRLGVKRVPDHQDARDVLADVAREEGRRFHLPVEDEDDLAVIWRCWQMLDEALAEEEVGTAWFAPLRNLPVIPNAAGILTAPTRLLIDDMPGVAAALNVGDAVIRRKEGMWRAFQAAGVRSLTEAVAIEILQIQQTAHDGTVHARMEERRPALARVLDGDPDGIQRLTRTLGELSFPQASALRVRYHLPDFGLTSAGISLKALYVPAHPQDNGAARLISCPQDDGSWPWMLIAKEFARALYPGETPGPLASSLYVALNAVSLDAAHGALDDAGWPRLEHVEITPADAGPGAGFVDDDPGAGQPEPDQPGDAGRCPSRCCGRSRVRRWAVPRARPAISGTRQRPGRRQRPRHRWRAVHGNKATETGTAVICLASQAENRRPARSGMQSMRPAGHRTAGCVPTCLPATMTAPASHQATHRRWTRRASSGWSTPNAPRDATPRSCHTTTLAST